MTQVRLWQIVSQTANGIVFADASGNLVTLPAGTKDQILVINQQGVPQWMNNTALSTALEAKTDAFNAALTARAYTDAQIAALVDNAPVALNTLNELAQKLNGEETAINALMLQVERKAEKTEVVALVAQTKQETLMDCKAYTDDAIGTIVSGIATQIGQAKRDVLTQAALDASFKADTAQANAVQAANSYTDQHLANAISAANQNNATQIDAAMNTAVGRAKTYTDQAVFTAKTTAAEDARSKAETAQNNAVAIAAEDVTSKLEALRNAIPVSFWVEGTATACFLASARNISRDVAINSGIVVTDSFTEITGAAIGKNDSSLNAKLLFVNGVAMGDEWTAAKADNGQLLIRFSGKLADLVFDGSDNALMILVEYRSYNAISQKS